MPANTSPIFSLTPKVGQARISTANTNRDGTGTLGTVYAAGANGSRIDRIIITGTGASTTAGMIRLFVYDGTNYRLWKEIPVTAVTPSGILPSFTATIPQPDQNPLLALPSGSSLVAGTHNADQFDVLACGSDF